VGKFADSVESSSFRVQNAPDYVFLCGASLKDPEHSLRAQFYNEKILPNPDFKARTQLSEDANEWYKSRDHFEDLLELEEYLAALSGCILLFVESPGAFAELGAFTQMASLRDKLLMIMEQFYEGKPSFIVDGPIQFATRSKFGRIRWYPWLMKPDGPPPHCIDHAGLDDTLDSIADELSEMLAEWKDKSKKRPRFEAGNRGHVMLLIADLVSLCVVCHESEIQKILAELGISCETSALSKCLYLLSKLGLIATEKYGHIYYFFGDTTAPDYIWYAPKAPADRRKLADRLREDLPMSNEKRKAYEAHIRRKGGARP
jgi:hypothetical protein